MMVSDKMQISMLALAEAAQSAPSRIFPAYSTPSTTLSAVNVT